MSIIKLHILTVVIYTMILSTTNVLHASEIYNLKGNKLDFCGKIEAFQFSSKNVFNKKNRTNLSLSLIGKTKISNNLFGYGKWKYNFPENNSKILQGSKPFLAYVGIQEKTYGSLDYGYNYSLIQDALSYTYIFSKFYGSTIHNSNIFTGQYIRSMTTYRNRNFFGLVNGLNFGIQYIIKNELTKVNTDLSSDKNKDWYYLNGSGWTGYLNYIFDNGLSVIGAYGVANTYDQKDISLKRKENKIEQWITGLKYDSGDIYLAANFGKTHNVIPTTNNLENRTKDILLIAQYKLNFCLRPSIMYVQSKTKEGNKNLIKYIELGITQFFNKKLSASIDYKIDMNNSKSRIGINNDNIVALGIFYQF